jgi:hypothetical protein
VQFFFSVLPFDLVALVLLKLKGTPNVSPQVDVCGCSKVLTVLLSSCVVTISSF